MCDGGRRFCFLGPELCWNSCLSEAPGSLQWSQLLLRGCILQWDSWCCYSHWKPLLSPLFVQVFFLYGFLRVHFHQWEFYSSYYPYGEFLCSIRIVFNAPISLGNADHFCICWIIQKERILSSPSPLLFLHTGNRCLFNGGSLMQLMIPFRAWRINVSCLAPFCLTSSIFFLSVMSVSGFHTYQR